MLWASSHQLLLLPPNHQLLLLLFALCVPLFYPLFRFLTISCPLCETTILLRPRPSHSKFLLLSHLCIIFPSFTTFCFSSSPRTCRQLWCLTSIHQELDPSFSRLGEKSVVLFLSVCHTVSNHFYPPTPSLSSSYSSSSSFPPHSKIIPYLPQILPTSTTPSNNPPPLWGLLLPCAQMSSSFLHLFPSSHFFSSIISSFSSPLLRLIPASSSPSCSSSSTNSSSSVQNNLFSALFCFTF